MSSYFTFGQHNKGFLASMHKGHYINVGTTRKKETFLINRVSVN